ncbi:MAG: NADH:flavin oxidoreductase, partial [Desulfobacca sp.]|nr:NADH:flavin oxidoreductase [Desulfobacca sp.]
GCFDSVFQAWPVSCLVNPRAGLEKQFPVTPADQKKKVLVIGGGPAGMMAAVTAAQRGHEIVLYEKQPILGGQLPLAACPPGREEMAILAFDLVHQLNMVSVEIHLNQEVTPGLIGALQPQAVVVATGAKPLIPPIPGIKGPQVHTAWEVLSGQVDVESPVVIIGGGAVGCETALFLAKTGTINAETLLFLFENQAETPERLYELILKGNKDITIIEMLSKLGKDIGQSTRWSILQDIHRRGIQTQVSSKVIEILPNAVVFEKDNNLVSLPARTVIIAVGAQAENGLYEQLKGVVPELHLIGDAKSPRKALEAVREGFQVGLKI